MIPDATLAYDDGQQNKVHNITTKIEKGKLNKID
jgi:hypothetical protein